MASLDLATLRVNIEADSSAAIKGVEGIRSAVEGVADEAQQAAKASESAVKNAADSAAQSVESASKRAGTSIQDVSKKLTEIGGSMTLKVTAPIIAAFTASVKGASDLNETVSKTGEVFKEQSDMVMDWSEGSIESMGLAQGTALDMASTFGDMGTSMGQTRAEASEMSTSLVQLAADMASFKNISTDRAATALTAIYTGETEALKSLGIVMTQANLEAFALSQGITTQISAMSQAEQVQLRYQYVMAQTANAQGDFVRTGGSLANQSRKLVQSIKQLGESFGKLLLPAVTSVVTTIQGAVQWLTEDDSGLKQVILTIAGVVAAIGPLLLVGGKIIKMITGIKAALAALSLHPMALAIMGVVAAVGAAGAAISSFSHTAREASDDYERLKAIVEEGVEGKVSVDTSQLAELNTNPPQIYVTADVSNALEAAKGIAAELTKPEYAGEIAIDGDTAAGQAALAELLAAIDAAEAAITIDGDGNAIIGDAGIISQLEDAIASAEGVLPISINSENYATVSGQLDELKRQLALVDVNIDISSDKAAFDAKVDAFKAKLDELGWKTYGGFGQFTVSGATTDEINEYATALAAAAQATEDYDAAVSDLDAMVDQKVAAQTAEINAQSAEQVIALARAYNSGVLTYDEYIAKSTEVYEAGEERIRQIEQQAELEKELNETYADGSKKNDAPAAAEKTLELVGGQGLTTEDFQNASAVLNEAADAGKNMTQYQTEAMIVNQQLADQAVATYDAMIAAQEEYDDAVAEAETIYDTDRDRQQAIVDEATYLTQAAQIYAQGLAAYGEGEGALDYTQDMLENMGLAADEAEAITARLREALTVNELDGDGNVIGEALTVDPSVVESVIGDFSLMAEEANAGFAEIEADYQERLDSAESAFSAAIGSLVGDLSTAELQLLLQLTASTGMAMSQVDQNLVLGMQSAAEGMVAELSSGRDDAAREVSGLISDIGKQTGSAKSQGVPVGESIINGIIDGCGNRGGALSSTIRSLVRAGIDAGKEESDSHSPSRVTMREIGEPLMQGIEVGFTNRLPEALKTIRSGMDNLMTGAARVVDHGTYTTPALPAVSRSVTAIDYDRLADAVAQRPSYFNVGTRQLAQATDEATARAQASRQRSVAIGYGLAR